ncbi:MAG: adenosylcobinamide-GDP ribazoletransferase [Alphaproteobacteria bacterium]
MVHQFEKFLIALQFLTRLPIPGRLQSVWGMEDLRDSVHMFPLVGVVVGLGAGLVCAAAVFCNLPPVISAILAVAAQILMTGALHEDGLADVCDGFGGGRTREEKLAIMRDSRLGTYGALGLILNLALRIGAIGAIAQPADAAFALIAAAALSRAAMPAAMRLLPQARAEGLAASAGRPQRGRVLLGVGLGVVVSFLCLPVMVAGVAIAASFVAGALSLGIARRQIGGITGDVLGGLQQVVEVLTLLTVAAFAGR